MKQNLKEHREILRKAYMDLAIQMKPNAFVTLATNNSGNVAEMTRLIGKLCGMVDREILGNQWHKLPIEERINGLFIVEHAKTNIHAHGLLRFPDVDGVDLPMILALKWNRLTEAGSTDFQEISDPQRLAGYCTKEMQGFQFDPDQVVVVSQFKIN